jgi:hypothetical protein
MPSDVEAHLVDAADLLGVDILVLAKAVDVRRDGGLDDEGSVVGEMRGDVLEQRTCCSCSSRLKNVL